MARRAGAEPTGTPFARRVAAVVLAAGALLSSCAVAPSGPAPIGPHQRFRGLVNGSSTDVVVTTVCGGPVWAGRTGPVLAGQTLSVTRDDAGAGDTGSTSVIFAQPTTASMVVAPIDTYDTAVPFPPDLQVPCDGTGTIVFTPCFGIAGCLGGAQQDVVKVRFVNIAV